MRHTADAKKSNTQAVLHTLACTHPENPSYSLGSWSWARMEAMETRTTSKVYKAASHMSIAEANFWYFHHSKANTAGCVTSSFPVAGRPNHTPHA